MYTYSVESGIGAHREQEIWRSIFSLHSNQVPFDILDIPANYPHLIRQSDVRQIEPLAFRSS